MKIMGIFLVLLGLAMAFTVMPTYHGVKYTGDDRLPKFNTTLAIDCTSNELNVDINSNQSGQLSGQIYLFYTDYGYHLIGTSNTNTEGKGKIKVIGNQDFLTALFIFRADVPGYQSQEIEFNYSKCFEEPIQNTTKPNVTNQTPPINNTPNQTPNQTNQTPVNNTPAQPANNSEPLPPEQPSTCPLPGLFIIMLLYGMVKQ